MPGDVYGRHYPTVSLAEARLICAELKLMRANGRCLATEQRERKAKEQSAQQDRQNQPAAFTVKDVVDLYLTKHCEDRKVNGKIISGVRKTLFCGVIGAVNFSV